MKKRNKPILMATLLLVFVAAAVGMNAMFSSKPTMDQMQAQQQEEKEKLGSSRTEDTTAATNAAADKLARGNAPIKPMAPRPNSGPRVPNAPGQPGTSIMKPKGGGVYTPVPNDSSTNAHWYRNEFGYDGDKSKQQGHSKDDGHGH